MPNTGKAKLRICDRVIRRVVDVGWNGGSHVRFDVGGSTNNPKFCVFVPVDHEIADTQPGARLPGKVAYAIVRRSDSIRRDGRPELRFDLGGTPTKTVAHVYCNKKNSLFAQLKEGDVISI